MYYYGQEFLRRNRVALIINKRIQNAVLTCKLKINKIISIHFGGTPIGITVIRVYFQTSDAEEDKVGWFYEDLPNRLELTHTHKCNFIVGDRNAKIGSQEIPGITSKFGLEAQNEAGQRPTEFCQEKTLVIANTPFQQHRR